MDTQDLLQSVVPAATKRRPTLAQQRAIPILQAVLPWPNTQSEAIEIAKRLLDYSSAHAARLNARERIRQCTRKQISDSDPPTAQYIEIALEKF